MKKTKRIAKQETNINKLTKNSSIIQLEKTSQSQMVKNLEITFDQFQELFQDVNISSCIDPVTKTLSLKRLISLLQNDFNIFIKDKIAKFYLEHGGVYITVPSTKKALSTMEIDPEQYLSIKTLKFQFFKNKQLIDVVMEDSQQESDENGDDEEDNQNDQKIMEGKCRRLKERKIKHVIQKVLKWRELYAGIQNGQENIERVSLQEGAKIVKISKKTLDDYLSQLKKGKKYGFNFNDHKNEKIGVLRQFIRKMEKKK